MRLSWFVVASGTLFQCASAVGSWYFTWTDPSNNTHSESSSTPDACIKIDNPIGKHFDWTASDGWCISFWPNTNCTGSDVGHTCKSWPWRQNAESSHLRSFRVTTNGSDTTTSPSSTSTSSPTDDDDNGDGSLSGGAIAGIVIGVVVAGVAILAVAVWFFLFYRRRQKSTEPGSPDTGDAAIRKNTESHYPACTTLAEMPDSQKEKPSELMGDNIIVELSDTHRAVELDATETFQRRT